jgi:hypothetical protein
VTGVASVILLADIGDQRLRALYLALRAAISTSSASTTLDGGQDGSMAMSAYLEALHPQIQSTSGIFGSASQTRRG